MCFGFSNLRAKFKVHFLRVFRLVSLFENADVYCTRVNVQELRMCYVLFRFIFLHQVSHFRAKQNKVFR